MRSKTFLIIVLAVIVVAAGLIFTRPRAPIANPATVSAPPSSNVSSLLENIPAGPSDDVAALLDSTKWFVQIKPRSFDPLVESWKKFAARISSLDAWKKLNPGELAGHELQQALSAEWAKQSGQGAFPAEAVEAQFQSFAQEWRAIDEILVAASGDAVSFKTKGGQLTIPKVLLRVKYAPSEEERAKNTFEKARAEMLREAQSADPKSGFSAKETEGVPDSIDFTLTSSEASAPLNGKLVRNGTTIETLAGADTAAVFFSPDTQHRLSATPRWKNVLSVLSNAPAISVFLSTEFLSRFFEEAVRAASEQGTSEKQLKQMDAILKLYKEMDSAAFAVDFNEGVGLKSCIQLIPNSTMSQLYGSLAVPPEIIEPRTREFAAMLDNQTILALHFALSPFATYYDSAFEAFKDAGESPEDKEVLRFVTIVQEAMSRLKFKTAGFLVGPPVMPPIIGAGVYFGGSELAGEQLLTAFTAAGNEIYHAASKAAGNEKGADIFELKKDEEGKPYIKANAGGLMLAGGLVGENTVLFSIDRELVNTFAKRAEKQQGYLDTLELSPALRQQFLRSDYFFYLHTDMLIDLASTFLPFIANQQSDQFRLEPHEIEQALKLLKVSFLSFQHTARDPGGSICSESKSLFLQPQASGSSSSASAG